MQEQLLRYLFTYPESIQANLWLSLLLFIQFFFQLVIFVLCHMYPENLEGTQVFKCTLKIGYDKGRNRTDNLFCHKHMPIPQGHCDGYSIIESEFLIEGNCLPSWTLFENTILRSV